MLLDFEFTDQRDMKALVATTGGLSPPKEYEAFGEVELLRPCLPPGVKKAVLQYEINDLIE